MRFCKLENSIYNLQFQDEHIKGEITTAQVEQQFTDIMLVLCLGVLVMQFFFLFTTFDWSFEKKKDVAN